MIDDFIFNTVEARIRDHTKYKGLVVTEKRSSLTRVKPGGGDFSFNLEWRGILILFYKKLMTVYFPKLITDTFIKTHKLFHVT